MWGAHQLLHGQKSWELAWAALRLTEVIQVDSLVLVGGGQRGEIVK